MRFFRSPVTGLFLLSPLVAEFFLGDFPVYLLPLILPLSLWYGAGAVLIREVARRAGRGCPTMLLLALAFGVVEEGLLTMSLFNPDYADQRLLDHGYVASLGIGLPWTIFVLALHVLWSVAAPVALIEEAQRELRTTPWLTGRGLVGIGGCLALGAVVTFATSYPAYGHFVASVPQLVSSAVVAAVIVTAAFGLPRRSTSPRPAMHAAPAARVVLAVTMVCAGAFQVGGHAERVTVSVPVMLVSLVALALAVVRGRGMGPVAPARGRGRAGADLHVARVLRRLRRQPDRDGRRPRELRRLRRRGPGDPADLRPARRAERRRARASNSALPGAPPIICIMSERTAVPSPHHEGHRRPEGCLR